MTALAIDGVEESTGQALRMGTAFSLQGRVALITGSTSGIGFGTARVLGEAGAHIVISSRSQSDCDKCADILRREGVSAEGLAFNLGSLEQIATVEAQLLARHGGIDILVNNAVMSPFRSIEDTDPGIFAKAMDVNIRGHWFVSAAGVRLMKRRGAGAIVNIGSIAASFPEKGLGLYATFKSSLVGMTRAFALEYGPNGIRSNLICPGLIKTPLAENAYDEKMQRKFALRSPLGRIGEVQDIGRAVQFLCAPSGSFITGTTLTVDGGVTVGLFED